MSRPRTRLAAAGAALIFAACDSPEADRVRGGGPGADLGNRDRVVELHGGSVIYSETPCLTPQEECPGPLPTSGLPEEPAPTPDTAKRS